VIAYVLPTRDRPDELAHTLDALGSLPTHDAEVVVVDNASRVPPKVPLRLANELPVRLELLDRNRAAAARNVGVQLADPGREWIVMLDDDSSPLSIDHVRALKDQPPSVAALAAEIWLSPPASAHEPRRESGGLPEVFIGCGVALRRQAFLDAGGYDPAFHFYAEEYDLAAKLMHSGFRVELDRRFQVHHRKVANQRRMDTILRRLVRNNCWVMQRYAPDVCRSLELRRTVRRYAGIALKERAELGFAAGLASLPLSLSRQPRRAMPKDLWDRFTGKAACRAALQAAWSRSSFRTATLIEPGKNQHIVSEVLHELGVRIVDARADAEKVVIATLSPGPMLDAHDLVGPAAGDWLLCPWELPSRPAHASSAPPKVEKLAA
jgi:GT2 family glycosyltransferase